MRILVTNDDGIGSAGIGVLEEIAKDLSEDVWVCAPQTNQSGAGHSLTIREPLRWRKHGERHFALSGTPTDCVLVALQKLVPERKFDLVLSGINHGANLGEDVTYSGTVAAAMEATLLGVPAIAVSQVTRDRAAIDWSLARHVLPGLVRALLANPWRADVLININLPPVGPEALAGQSVTLQGRSKIGDELIERIDPRGEQYVWIGAVRGMTEIDERSDIAAISRNELSITPIHLDMTHYPTMEQLRGQLGRR